ISLTLDRPASSGLDQSQDRRAIFTIQPRVEGRLEWRDPVTIRFVPAAALAAGATYTVTIATAFQALDGSRLERPYSFAFRVRGPQVQDVSPYNGSQYLTPGTRFKLLLAGPADLPLLESMLRIDASSCGRGEIRVKVQRQRRIVDAAGRGRWYRASPPDTVRARHRVVELAPVAPLPLGCALKLRTPVRVDSVAAARVFQFSTYGRLVVNRAWCAARNEPCPAGPVTLEFSTPVKGAEVARHVRLVPAVPFTVGDTGASRPSWTLDLRLLPRRRYLVVVDSGVTDAFGQRLSEPFSTTIAATNTARPGAGTLQLIRISSPQVDTTRDRWQPLALVQVTDLAIHARVGLTEAAVWVTGVKDGKPRSDARITLYDAKGRPRANAVTDAQGLARLRGLTADTTVA